jgi:hypothetical protein
MTPGYIECCECGKYCYPRNARARKRGLCRTKCDGIQRDGGGWALDSVLRRLERDSFKATGKPLLAKQGPKYVQSASRNWSRSAKTDR